MHDEQGHANGNDAEDQQEIGVRLDFYAAFLAAFDLRFRFPLRMVRRVRKVGFDPRPVERGAVERLFA